MSHPQLEFRCPEKFSSMSPKGEDRHCAVCNRIVTDFSGKTNDEILSVLQERSGKSCGHFRAVQLSNPFNDRRDRIVSLYQTIAQSSRRRLPKSILLGLATALLFLSGCHERLTGAYETRAPKKHKPFEKHQAKPVSGSQSGK